MVAGWLQNLRGKSWGEKLKGQWLGRFEAVENSGGGKNEGNLLIDIDEIDGAFYGYAVVQNDLANLPITFTRFITDDTAPRQTRVVNMLCLDPRTWEPVQWSTVSHLYPVGFSVAPNAHVTLDYQGSTLQVNWTSSIQTGSATLPASQAGQASVLRAIQLPDWTAFKDIVETLPQHSFMFRGQELNSWRLRNVLPPHWPCES